MRIPEWRLDSYRLTPSAGQSMVLATIVAILSLSGCGLGTPIPDKICGDYATYLTQLADKLAGISSTAQADAASSGIRDLVAQVGGLSDKVAKIQADSAQSLSPEVEGQMTQAAERVQAEITRLQSANLITERLRGVLDEARLAQESFLASAKAGQLPSPESPLEEAVVELITIKGQFADRLGAIQNATSAETVVDELSNLWDKEYATLQRLAELGAESPPGGIPPRYADHFRAVTRRVEQADVRMQGLPDSAQIQLALAPATEHAPYSREDPFRLDASIRQAGTNRIVTVKLLNKDELQGPRHQRMVQMLAQAAGGANCEALINNEGYHVVLSPVDNLDSFIRSIKFGTVSDVNRSSGTLTLTIDPAQIP